MMKQFIVFVIFSIWGTILLVAQPRVSVQLDTTDILIGDQFNFEIIIELEKNAVLKNINYQGIEEASFVEVVQEERLDTISNDEYLIVMQRLILTSFDSGYHKIPSLPISYQQNGYLNEVRTNDLAFRVRTIPVNGEDVALSPIKDIIKEPIGWQDLLPYFLGALALVLTIVLGYRYYQQPKDQPITLKQQVVPAHELALEKLKKLQRAKLWQEGKIKQFQTELTYIVREYLENRFKIPALESTTEETLEMVRNIEEVDLSWNEKLRDMFQIADLVKFAKATPPADFHDQILVDAEHFVFDTKEDLSALEDAEPS